MPGLYLVATPIGNLGDITFRALETLKSADAVACEDTRVGGKLCSALGIKANLIRYDDHSGERARPEILARLARGEVVALISDAGTPLISDPGYKLVRAAVAQGSAVFPLPGASALLAGLIVSGLPTDRFLFAGFLDRQSGQRRAALSTLAELRASLIFYEGPSRLADSLRDMAEILGNREAVVARELTKLHEEVRRGLLADLAATYAEAGPPKGEVVIIVGPPDVDEGVIDIDGLLRTALGTMSVRDAAETVAQATGRKKRDVYARALSLSAHPEADK